MKRYILVLSFLITLLSSCKDSFLDLTDPTKIPTDNLFTSQANVTAAVNAVYNGLLSIYNPTYFVFGELSTDNAYEVVSANAHYFFNIYNVDPSNANLQAMWTSSYKCISRANTVLAKAGAVKMDTTLKNRYLAEMKFIRALNYFNLVRIWGDVPLVTDDLSDNYQAAYAYGRTPTAKVYDQIILDLKAAEAVLPTTYANADLGRPTSVSAKALLGKVYLTQQNYEQAVAKLGELIPGTPTAGKFATVNSLITTSYGDIFSTANEMNKEIVYAVRYLAGGIGLGSTFASAFEPLFSGADIVQLGGVAQRLDLYTAYAGADKRATFSTTYYTKSGQADYFTRKYIINGPPYAVNDGDNDWIVLRYSDVLLMHAEALNELGKPTDALPYINQVRARAGLPNLTGLSQSDLRLAIETERRLEFSFEGHRWFDLVRTNRLIPVMNAFYTKYSSVPNTVDVPNKGLFVKSGGAIVQVQQSQMLFPIPLAEIQYNPILTQNPGY
ncbi:RagB/SusD family nutrient uptake outer membrane protein [Spirosoma sp. HMF4905]|uniref:RagB/SusD family nutrient uptake outer membrane protein n=2 Tax=Spirosoma TaxID=107 RepID=A0A7K1SH89_9BACT|nr:RagB/SusD family nutrient uptake outer membrane protein [Spirosoma arboris]MVM33175.1 RagB/SusD family nutrient uptake outer membrane protein [Spirosoma arboris]